MKKVHLILLLLLTSLLGVTLYLQPWKIKDQSDGISAALTKADNRPVTKGVKPKEINFLDKDFDLSAKGVEDIYKHTLFLSERELKKIQQNANKTNVSAHYDFELTGAGRLGKKEFAVILAKPKSNHRKVYNRSRQGNSYNKPVAKKEEK